MKFLILFTILFALIFTAPVIALAIQAGTCQSLNQQYGRIVFKLEQCADLEYAVAFAKTHRGQIITDQDSGIISVIWHGQIAAPASQYTCSHISED